MTFIVDCDPNIVRDPDEKYSKVIGRHLVDPADRMSPTSEGIIDHAHESNTASGFYKSREEQAGFWATMASSKWNSVVGAGFQSLTYRSKAATLNFMGRNIFESSSGLNRGTTTASAMHEKYHRNVATQMLPIRGAMNAWAQINNRGAMGSRFGISKKGQAEYIRATMLERNARQHGHALTEDQNIIRGADALDSTARESLVVGKGREGEHSVLGMENISDNPHYTFYNWSGAKVGNIVRSGIADRADIITALAQSYRDTGMALGKDADKVAEAVIRRSELNDAEIDSSVHSLLQADGQEFLRDTLERSGVKGNDLEGIMQRLVGAAADRGKEGFAKSRNEIDMSTVIRTKDGSNLQIVDLLSHDMMGDWQRYIRRIAGAGALARQGITSRAARKEFISAVHAEQRALGEPLVPRQELEAMFSSFDGGAVKGWSKLEGGEPSPAGQGVSMMKRLVQLAWLNKLGLTQLGETGAMIAQNGLATSIRRGPLGNLSKEIRKGNAALMEDISYLVGELGMDQHLFASHLNLDEVSSIDGADFLSRTNHHLATASYIQSFTSMFNHVRGAQQKTAALGVMDKVFRQIKRGATKGEMNRMWGDLGLDAPTVARLKGLIDDGTIEFSANGSVNRMHADKWDGDLQDIVGSSIIRNINQLVQKSMAGELDSWVHTGLGSALSHLKQFPMQATHKQIIRHFRHNDVEAYSAVMYGLGTAAVASVIREGLDQAGGKEGEWMSAADHGKRAFAYGNMTGFLPMAYDPIVTMMGLDDMRFNQFGSQAEIAPPILSFANDAVRLPGALFAAATGNSDWDDKKAIRTLPFANTILFGEMMQSIGQKDDDVVTDAVTDE
jgi:hypothetical protein